MTGTDALTRNINEAPGAGLPDAYTQGVNASGGGGGTGPVLIASGSITPGSDFPILLPGSYAYYKIDILNLVLNADNRFACALSQNSGVTWICDSNGFDSYAAYGDTVMQNADSLLQLGNYLHSSGIISVYVYPGSASSWAAVGTGNTLNDNSGGCINPAATITPTEARVNAILLLPKGNGDIPPTSGETITSGIYRLWGFS